MKKQLLLCLILIVFLSALPVGAASMKVFVAGVSAVGVTNREEMQATLQAMIASRLTGASLIPVSSAAEADVIVTGNYLVIGKAFSFDAVATTRAGKTITRVFLDGEDQDQLIQVVSKLSYKLAAALVQGQEPGFASSSPPTASSVSPPVAATLAGVPPVVDIIKLNDSMPTKIGSWSSQPREGVFNLIANGSRRDDNSHEFLLADDRRLFHYRQGSELQLLAMKELKVYEKIIALDTLDTGSGSMDIYLTVISNGQLASKVWQSKGGSLYPLAEDFPYFFRTMELPGSPRKLFVQKTAGDRTFSGEVFEAERVGAAIILKTPLSLPPATSIYSFAKLRDSKGDLLTAVLNADNNLAVYNRDHHEIWRSSEKYGGSELYMEIRNIETSWNSEEGLAKIYLNQRMQSTAEGDLLVGKNDAFWFLGKSRSYKDGTIFCMKWNGESLVGKWQTRSSAYYLPDFYYDAAKKELLMIEVISKGNIVNKGTSAISIKRVE